MKKNVLALSITAALVGFGFAGGAQAIGLSVGAVPPSGTATNLIKSSDGVGHYLYVPYYSAQSGNNTMINLVNTDSVNGKAVKIRFRGAANSDDFFDFQVFLSPNDVWNASISQGADGLAKLATSDNSCTKPARGATTNAILGTLNGTPFRTDRLFSTDAAWAANQTREGYVEIFNMADIDMTSQLGKDILHAQPSGVPASFKSDVAAPYYGGGCSSTAFTALDTDLNTVAQYNTAGLKVPTTGLFSNWIILNANNAGAWSGASPALVAVDNTFTAAAGALVYFPQLGTQLGTVAQNNLQNFTADGWLYKYRAQYASYFDLPDFSTPYTGGATPPTQAATLSAALATTSLANEFLALTAIGATTDWVLSMPTRRYFTQFDYKASPQVQLFSATTLPAFGGFQYFSSANTTVVGGQICVTGIGSSTYNQEEYIPTGSQPGPIISPRNPDAPSQFLVCGEASVLSFNSVTSGSLKATVARSMIDAGTNQAGWTFLTTPGLGTAGTAGLPIVGYAAYRASNGNGTFGATLPHRTNFVNK